MSYAISYIMLAKIAEFIFVILLFFSPILFAKNAPGGFKSSIRTIPKKIQLHRQKHTWNRGCPVALDELAYVKLSYWGFDKKAHDGALIVNKALAKEVVDIFKVLYEHKFPIQKMVLMDAFDNDDDEGAMTANNTSSFACREVTGQPGIFSQHSYGRAIDINPLINPYVKNNKVLPVNSAQFVDRNTPYPGKITKENIVYREFIKRGWDWGGHWYDVQDYQYFEKRANGERRNPYGY